MGLETMFKCPIQLDDPPSDGGQAGIRTPIPPM